MKQVCLFALLAFGVAGCSSTVMVQVPPRMLLDRTQTIGIVKFDAEGARGEDHNVTGKFIEAIQQAQPGVAILELGASSELLNGVGKSQLNAEAVQEIGKKFNVDAVIVGALLLKESQPKVDVNLNQGFRLDSLQAKAQIRLDGRLDTKLLNTSRGASVWTGSSARWINLAQASGGGLGFGSVNLPDRERQYEKLICDMVSEASTDFRPTWERRAKQ